MEPFGRVIPILTLRAIWLILLPMRWTSVRSSRISREVLALTGWPFISRARKTRFVRLQALACLYNSSYCSCDSSICRRCLSCLVISPFLPWRH